jgi:hypothetical protein
MNPAPDHGFSGSDLLEVAYLKAASLSAEIASARPDGEPLGFLRAMVAVVRSARRDEYMVVHFGSGTFFRTDRLGALAIRALMRGRSDAQAIQLVEGLEPGSGVRARWLIDLLGSKGAMSHVPGSQAGMRSRLRRRAGLATGLTMSILARFVRVTPAPVLAWTFGILPSTAMGRSTWRTNRLTILNALRANGSVTPTRPNPQRNFLFMYLGTVLTPAQLSRLVEHLFDRASVDELSGRLQATGPTVGVFLHSPLCVAVPNVLRNRGHEVIRVLITRASGINVSQRASPLRDFYGESTELSV